MQGSRGKRRSPFRQMDRALGESFGARFIWVDWNATSPSTCEERPGYGPVRSLALLQPFSRVRSARAKKKKKKKPLKSVKLAYSNGRTLWTSLALHNYEHRRKPAL